MVQVPITWTNFVEFPSLEKNSFGLRWAALFEVSDWLRWLNDTPGKKGHRILRSLCQLQFFFVWCLQFVHYFFVFAAGACHEGTSFGDCRFSMIWSCLVVESAGLGINDFEPYSCDDMCKTTHLWQLLNFQFFIQVLCLQCSEAKKYHFLSLRTGIQLDLKVSKNNAAASQCVKKKTVAASTFFTQQHLTPLNPLVFIGKKNFAPLAWKMFVVVPIKTHEDKTSQRNMTRKVPKPPTTTDVTKHDDVTAGTWSCKMATVRPSAWTSAGLPKKNFGFSSWKWEVPWKSYLMKEDILKMYVYLHIYLCTY